MKKIFSILLVAVMAIGFASCSDDKKKDDNSSTKKENVKDMTTDELVEYQGQLCQQMINAINAGDEAAIKATFKTMQEMTEKYRNVMQTQLTSEQQKRVEDAAYEVVMAAIENDVDLDKYVE